MISVRTEVTKFTQIDLILEKNFCDHLKEPLVLKAFGFSCDFSITALRSVLLIWGF